MSQHLPVLYLSLFVLTLFYVFLAPYNKVEESFNLQAIHDLLIHGPFNLEKFDHVEFPGVVPRTFLGSVMISILVYPQHLLLVSLSKLGWLSYSLPQNKLYLLLSVRGSLGSLVLFSWLKLGRSLRAAPGGFAYEKWYLFLTLGQFHPLFWGSRTLPNMFALILTNIGLTYWIKLLINSDCSSIKVALHSQELSNFLYWIIPAALIFRSEVAFFAGLLVVVDLLRHPELYFNSSALFQIFKALMCYSSISLLITLGVDSYFWRNSAYLQEGGAIWPEGYVFYFNAILGQSSKWGTSPFHAYFSSFLPKTLGLVYLPLLFGVFYFELFLKRSSLSLPATKMTPFLLYRGLVVPGLLYVVFMSCLGHKEWRFLVYTFPVFNIGAAVTLNELVKQRYLVWLFRLLISLSFLGSLLMSGISSLNYPGGEALTLAHRLIPTRMEGRVHVHIDVAAAVSGVSRFGEIGPGWDYSKEENLSSPYQFQNYTHLITPHPNVHHIPSSTTIQLLKISQPECHWVLPSWEIVGSVYGLSSIQRRSISEWSQNITCMANFLASTQISKVLPKCDSRKLLRSIPTAKEGVTTNITPQVKRLLLWVELLLPINVVYSPRLYILRQTTPTQQ